MISDPKTAKFVSDLMLKVFEDLRSSVPNVKGACSLEEYSQYKRAVGKIFDQIVFEVLEPIYNQHPDLKPPKWD